MHLRHATDDHKKLLLHSINLAAYYTIDHQTIGSSNGGDGVRAEKQHFPFEEALPTPVKTIIVGSVNGLVCANLVMNQKLGILIIWNPTTKVYKKLPPNPHVPVKQSHRIGFGYDSIADDYKVMRIVQYERPRLDIYSLKKDSWKLIIKGRDVPTPSPINPTEMRACCADGSFYWLACHMDGENLKDEFVACFDFKDADNNNDDVDHKKKVIREVAMPNDFETVSGELTDMKLLGGCLAVSKMNDYNNTVVVWKMMKIKKDNKEDYCWTKKVVIEDNTSSLMCGISDGVWLLPVCVSKDGKILLCTPSINSTELLLYDPKTKTIKDFHPIHWISKTGRYLEAITNIAKPLVSQNEIYIETLVSPNFRPRST